MKTPAVKFDQLEICFGTKEAVSGLSLEVAPGEVVGLVGRNGAGKTTALRAALGMYYPDGGQVRVFGLDPVKDALEVRTRCALLSEESSLYPKMTVREILTLGAKIHSRWDAKRAASLSDQLTLEPHARIQTLSRGGKAKVALVLAAATRPDLLLLDDPTAGLDPLVRREVLDGVLQMVADDGGAVLYATHLIQDVERVADRVAVLDGGTLRIDEVLEVLKERFKRVEAVFEGAPPTLQIEGDFGQHVDGRILHVVVDGTASEAQARLEDAGAKHIAVQPLSLEEILVAQLRQGRSNSEQAQSTERQHA